MNKYRNFPIPIYEYLVAIPFNQQERNVRCSYLKVCSGDWDNKNNGNCIVGCGYSENILKFLNDNIHLFQSENNQRIEKPLIAIERFLHSELKNFQD